MFIDYRTLSKFQTLTKLTCSLSIFCHFDEGEIPARNSAKFDSDCRAARGDFSFVEMTKMGIIIVENIAKVSTLGTYRIWQFVTQGLNLGLCLKL